MTWSVDPEIFSFGFISIRYYSLLFLVSFLLGLFLMKRFFKWENHDPLEVDDLLVYVLIGTVLGARLGHVLFYNPGHYFSNPVEIFKVWEGGLASHGGAAGIIIALYVFIKQKPHFNFLWLLDRVVIPVALAGSFIRLGNLFNSEIIGKPADVPWAFTFTRVDMIPRHPAQLYEAGAYLGSLVFLDFLYTQRKEKTAPGSLFGLFLILVFGFRIFVENFKENQEAFEATMALNMGQLLSIPLVLVGLYFFLSAKNRPLPPKPEPKAKQSKQQKKKKHGR